MRASPAIEEFERHRAHLFGVAYRMLGTVSDAEDAIQDVFLRWCDVDAEGVRNPRAWLTTVTSRHCLDVLKSARRKREVYVGPWLPEPLGGIIDPETEGARAESLTTAFLLVLERLSPLERAAFLLHDVFDYDYALLAQTLGRNEAACRKLVARARAHVRQERPRLGPPPADPGSMLGQFLLAIASGDVAGLERMLAADAEFWSDGGGRVKAALNVVRGANRVARLAVGLGRKTTIARVELTPINGETGVLIYDEAKLSGVLTAAFDPHGRILRVFLQRNPDKLTHFSRPDA